MLELNIIYNACKNRELLYENDIGRVWMESVYNNNMPNIVMNRASNKEPIRENDSMFIAEPICVSAIDYDVEFLKRFKYVFTWATKALDNTAVSNKLVYVNFPCYKGNPIINDINWVPWDKRSNEIVFIANNKRSRHPSELYSYRLIVADWFHAHSNFKVSWYGNMAIRRPYYRGKVINKNDVLRRSKFTVCMENSYSLVRWVCANLYGLLYNERTWNKRQLLYRFASI